MKTEVGMDLYQLQWLLLRIKKLNFLLKGHFTTKSGEIQIVWRMQDARCGSFFVSVIPDYAIRSLYGIQGVSVDFPYSDCIIHLKGIQCGSINHIPL